MKQAETARLTGSDELAARIKSKLERELGPAIMGYLSDPLVREVMLNSNGKLWVERQGEHMTTFGEMLPSQSLSLIATIASTLNVEVRKESPILECELPIDGSRFSAIVPPNVPAPVFTIRKKSSKLFTLQEYCNNGILSEKQFSVLQECVQQRKNILISGGTGSGKTTLTNAVIHEISKLTPLDRLVLIEDTAELQCASENFVSLRTSDFADMTQLLKSTLRMRPDRIVVGEVRDGSALALLKAWNLSLIHI